MLLIVGDTYDYRKDLRSLGGEWRKKYKGWDVPDSEPIREFMEEHPEFELMVLDTIEKLRERAQEIADVKADRLLERAAKRREKAAILQEPINSKHGDIAFFTQPNIDSSSGRAFTRQRERMYEKYHKGFELENEAEELESRAESIRCVQIKGDAERRREKEREEAFKKIKIGTKVDFFHTREIYTVVKINRKTIRIQKDSDPSRALSVDPLFVKVIE